MTLGTPPGTLVPPAPASRQATVTSPAAAIRPAAAAPISPGAPISPAAATGLVLWLVRHGESTWNVLGLAQGQSDQARLTRRGACQAQYVTDQLRGRRISAVYASDLRRAAATAAPLAAALGLEVTLDPRLRERSLGLLEGTASVAIPAALSGVVGDRVLDPDAWPPDGESLRDMYWRVAAFADDRLARGEPGHPAGNKPAGDKPAGDKPAGDKPAGDNEEIAIVAHGGTLRMLTAYLRGVPVERMSWEPIGNGCVVRLALQPGRRACSGKENG
jgi:broad specificity phosphatase PhoE